MNALIPFNTLHEILYKIIATKYINVCYYSSVDDL